MAALGHLIAGMAHEIRNPLNSVALFVQVLKPGLEARPEDAEILDRILQEVDRIDSILIKLLATSKRSRFSPEKVLVTEVIDRVLESLKDNLKTHRILVGKDFQTTPRAILADPSEIEQIFSNLFVNSIFEMQTGGRLDIRVAHDGNMIDILVVDSGKGVPRKMSARYLTPFSRPRKKAPVSGCRWCCAIVKSYGGQIWVESREEPGAVFHIEIPLKKEGEESLFGN